MKTKIFKISNIPSIIWGNKSEKLFIAVHGNISNKSDDVIRILAENVTQIGYQVLSFDLPEHGERINNKKYLCNPINCIHDLKEIIAYAKTYYNEINLFACSMGAYFSLLAYKDETINKCLFLSPVVNMKVIIDNLMLWSNTNKTELREKQEIKTDFGQTVYWDYYSYVLDNPISNWNKKTFILYGNKDNMQSEHIIADFSKQNNCNIEILNNGEHFFHTKEQLEYYEKWLNIVIKKSE